MVHKKYTYKKGKRYGPYLYETKRVNGRIVTTYLGPAKKKKSNRNFNFFANKNRKFLGLLSFLILAVLLLSFFLYPLTLTGKVSLDLSPRYDSGELLTGDLRLDLKSGELIPLNSLVIVSLGEETKEFFISDLVDSDIVEGEFFIEGTDVSGSGEGYGLIGERAAYPEVDFDLLISGSGIDSDEEGTTQETDVPTDNESLIVNQTNNETIEEPADGTNETISDEEEPEVNETIEEDASDIEEDVNITVEEEIEEDQEDLEEETESVAEEEVTEESQEEILESDEEPGSTSEDAVTEEVVEEEPESTNEDSEEETISIEPGITGSVIYGSDGSFIVSGTVKEGEEFVYDLEEGQSAKIFGGSVKVDGEGIGNENVDLEIEDNKAIVTTDYSVTEKGFGSDYLGEAKKRLNIDIEDFGLIAANSSIFNIEIVFEEETILEVERDISVLPTIQSEAVNESDVNETIANETEFNISVEIKQFGAVLGEPVKWVKTIEVNGSANLSVEIPESAGNITVRQIDDEFEEENAEEDIDPEIESETEETETNETIGEDAGDIEEETDEAVEEVTEETQEDILENDETTAETSEDSENEQTNEEQDLEEKITIDINGAVVFSDEESENVFDSIFGGLTGFVVSNETDLSDNIQEIDIEINASTDEVEIEYYTSAPSVSFEEEDENGKRIGITSPEDVHYENVLLFTNLAENLGIKSQESIKIYWEENETFLPVFNATDLNNNGIFDYVEWVAPHLSNQTFNIIVIVKAEHLDEDRSFVSDIFEEVRQLDNNWSETIPDTHYVRVTFERNLSSQNDITIYPRIVNGTPRIEIFEENGTELIAEFTSLNENQYNKVFLDSLQNVQDVFDLRILDGNVEFDHIVDPTTPPNVSFVSPTPDNASTQGNNDIYVNISSSDDSRDHYAFVDFNRDLVLHIGSDETNGTDPLDLSSYGNNGTVDNGAVLNTTGVFGNSTYFDSSNDLINITTTDELVLNNTKGNMTIAFWVFETEGSGFVEQLFEQDNGYRCQIWHADDRLYCYYYINGAYRTFFTGSAVPRNTWFHGATTLEHDGTTFTQRFYIDGENVKNSTYTAGVGTLGTSTSDLDLGTWTGNSNDLKGNLDEFMIFNRTLGPKEIKALYNSTTTQYENNFTNLPADTYEFKGYAIDLAGNLNETQRTVTITDNAISSCTSVYVISSSGTYTVTNDLTTTGDCIEVAADDVIIEGNGYTIDGDDGFGDYGINTSFVSNVTVRNLILTDFDTILRIEETNYSKFTNLNISSAGFFAGILLTGGHNNTFSENIVSKGAFAGTTDALDMTSSDQNFIFDNNFSDNGGHGINFVSSNDNIVSNNSFNYNQLGLNIPAGTTQNNIFSNNTIFFNDNHGISIAVTRHNAIRGNNISSHEDNGNNGIAFSGGNVTIANNIIEYNDGGVSISGVEDLKFINNTFLSNNISLLIQGITDTSDVVNLSFENDTIDGSTEIAINFGGTYEANITFRNVTIVNTASGKKDLFIKESPDDGYQHDGLHFIDTAIASYDIGENLSDVIFENTVNGEIRFLESLGSGNSTNLSRDIRIANNSVTILTNNTAGFNRSANISLYGNPGSGLSSLEIQRDGETCAGSICYNFTALSAATVIFNVTHWTNYSIGGVKANLTECGVLDKPNTTYYLVENVSTTGSCFTITASDIILEGGDNEIEGDNEASDVDYGVNVSRFIENVTIRNLNVTNFGTGIIFEEVNSSLISEVAVFSSYRHAILFNASSYNVVDNSTLNSQTLGGSIRLDIGDSGNNFNNITNNECSNNVGGINVIHAFNTLVEKNTCNSNTEAGLYLQSNSNSTTVNNNTFNENGQRGIWHASSSMNVIENNTASSSVTGADGIAISGADAGRFNLVNYNNFSGNDDPGMVISATFNNFTGNILNFNKWGFQTSATGDNNIFVGGEINNNTEQGIVNSGSEANKYINISMDSNGFDAIGIFVAGALNNVFENITLRNTNVSYRDFNITVVGVNGTQIIDTHIGNYSILGGSTLTVNDSRYGGIKFLEGVGGAGNNLSSDIWIRNNSAQVLTNNTAGFNKSAIVSLLGTPGAGITNPAIFRDGETCASGICYNFTSLAAETVLFNVSYWSNYSIGGGLNITQCGELSSSNKIYTQVANIVPLTAPCINITAENVTFNGNGFWIVNSTLVGDGIYSNQVNSVVTRANVTMRKPSGRGVRFEFSNGSTVKDSIFDSQETGIEFLDSSFGTSENNTANFNTFGIFVDGGSFNNITNNTAEFNTQRGINVVLSNGNILINNNVESAFLSGISLDQSNGTKVYGGLVNNISWSNIGRAIFIQTGASHNLIENVTVNATVGEAIYMDSITAAPFNNTFDNVTILNSQGADLRFTTGGMNETIFRDTYIEIYNFTSIGEKIIIEDSDFGEIRFLERVNGSGSNFSNDIRIANNSVAIEHSQLGNNAGLNRSANITLYSFPGAGITNPAIFRDGETCASGICYNFTSLSAENVVFNVSYWTSYSIGEAPSPPDINFTDPTPGNATTQLNTDVYVNVSSNDSEDHYTFVDFDRSLLLWMRMDDTNSSNDPTDLSSYSRNGTLFGTVINKTGIYGNSSHFDGDGDYIDLPDMDALFTSGLSSCSWVYWNSFSESWSRVFDFGQGQADDNVLFAHNGLTSDLTYEVYVGATSGGKVTATGVLFTGVWQHLCVSQNSSGDVRLYVNGTNVVNGTTSIPATVTRQNSYLGRSGWASDGNLSGRIDELLLFNRSLSDAEIASLYNASANQYEHNFTSQNPGIHNFVGHAVDTFANRNMTETKIVTINAVPTNPSPAINSTDLSNLTTQDLYCNDQLVDIDGGAMNLTVKWLNGSTESLTVDFNNSYANSTILHNITLDSGNTSHGETWRCSFRLFDGFSYSDWVNSSGLVIINSLPSVPVLSTPADGATVTERKPTFTWAASSDDDSEDTLTYEINVSLTAASTCTQGDIYDTSISGTSHQISNELSCFFDNQDYYNWSVRAYDGTNYSDWSGTREVNLSSILVVSLPNASVEFGSVNITVSGNDNTTDNSPFPFLIQNDGNAISNVTIEATDLWNTASNPTQYYQYKIDNYTTENNSFAWSSSVTTFTNIPANGTGDPPVAIGELNWSNATDTAEIDINITVPINEASGVRSSIVTFISKLAEG